MKKYTFIKKYTMWFLFIITILALFSFIVRNFSISSDTILPSYPVRGIKYTVKILLNNTINFIQYLVLFPLSPIFLIIDLFLISLQIKLSTDISGINSTIKLLAPYFFLEFPNIVLYSLLSIESFYILIRKKKLNAVYIFINENKYIYLFSFIILVISAFIEGFILI